MAVVAAVAVVAVIVVVVDVVDVADVVRCECDTRHRKNVNFSGKKFISETSHKILLKIKSETEMRNRLPTKLTENSGILLEWELC